MTTVLYLLHSEKLHEQVVDAAVEKDAAVKWVRSDRLEVVFCLAPQKMIV